jgi:hypothetical protein
MSTLLEAITEENWILVDQKIKEMKINLENYSVILSSLVPQLPDSLTLKWKRQTSWLVRGGANLNFIIQSYCENPLPINFYQQYLYFLEITREEISSETSYLLLTRIVQGYHDLNLGSVFFDTISTREIKVPKEWDDSGLLASVVRLNSSFVLWALIAEGVDFKKHGDKLLRLAFNLGHDEIFEILLDRDIKPGKKTTTMILNRNNSTNNQSYIKGTLKRHSTLPFQKT